MNKMALFCASECCRGHPVSAHGQSTSEPSHRHVGFRCTSKATDGIEFPGHGCVEVAGDKHHPVAL